MNLTPALIATIIDLLKKAGIIRDPEAEARAIEALRNASAQFLLSTSGPIYAISRVIVIYASLWDIFLNSGRAWAATGMHPMLELVPVFWLFLGPEVVAPAAAAFAQAFSTARSKPTRTEDPPAESPRGRGGRLE